MAAGTTVSTSDLLDDAEYAKVTRLDAAVSEAIALLTENQPEQPLVFLRNHFAGMARGTTPLISAYRLLRRAPKGTQAFQENLLAAYQLLDQQSNKPGRSCTPAFVSGSHLLHLIAALSQEVKVAPAILEMLGKSEADAISLDEFSAGIATCLMYEEMFAVVAELFRSLDLRSAGSIPRTMLVSVLESMGRHRRGADDLLRHLHAAVGAPGDDGDADHSSGLASDTVTLAELQRRVFQATLGDQLRG